MSKLTKLLGDKLLNKNDEIDTTNVSKNEVIALYFSAHWCGPCKQFTPEFIKTYNELRTNKNKAFQVVFVSSDRNQGEFNEYYGTMPWLAIPFKNRDIASKLSKKYGIMGIPSVILIDGNGKLITKNGRESVLIPQDYPWIPPTITEALGNEFVSNKDMNTTVSLPSKKYLGLYFSAHWCPPCKQFTPILVETYQKIINQGHDFEIIFISSDRDEESFNDYFATMPWLSLPYKDRQRKNTLSQLFNVEGIPTFIVLDEHHNIINEGARSAVMMDQSGAEFPWIPKAVNDLDNPDGLRENPSLIILCEGETKDKQERIRTSIFNVVASLKEQKEGKQNDDDDDDDGIKFFIGTNGKGVASQIRSLTKLGDPNEKVEKYEIICDGDMCRREKVQQLNNYMLILDIQSDGAFYVSNDQPTEENIKKFVQDFKNGKLERKQLGT